MRLILGSLICGTLAACSVTNTGNPNAAPAGMELVRSALERDTAPSVTGPELEQFGRDRRDLTFALYQQLKDTQDNLFFSPYSISTALAMAYAGAEGDTEREMAEVLRFSQPEATLHAAFNASDLALAGRANELAPEGKGDGLTLRVNNAAFVQRGLGLRDAYLDVLAVNYDSGLYVADFAADPERQRTTINDWVLEQTEQRIEELLPEGSINRNTALVLTNTIYFKASWLVDFDPALTEEGSFHAPGGDQTVQMMHGRYEDYARGDNYQAVELSYLSPDVRMLLILPDEGKQAELELGLDRALFDDARSKLSRHNVDLRLPRFSFRASAQLKGALQALGMTRAFTKQADFSGMAGDPGDLLIDEIYHQAFIAVDERGTEAAAATALVWTEVSAPPHVEVTFDRPFLFFVHDEPTGQILFAGRLAKPGE